MAPPGAERVKDPYSKVQLWLYEIPNLSTIDRAKLFTLSYMHNAFSFCNIIPVINLADDNNSRWIRRMFSAPALLSSYNNTGQFVSSGFTYTLATC